MSAAQWLLAIGFGLFAAGSLRVFHQVAARRGASDLAVPKGGARAGVAYSLTRAMLPWKKESARFHPLVYILGVAYHAGTFLAFLWLAVLAIGFNAPAALRPVSAGLLALAALAGASLLVRRIAEARLRYFSSPDDYFSNILVTVFQTLAALTLVRPSTTSAFLIYGGLVLAYIPLGKLRHALYYALARYYLGIFYGRRGVWSAESGMRWRRERP